MKPYQELAKCVFEAWSKQPADEVARSSDVTELDPLVVNSWRSRRARFTRFWSEEHPALVKSR